MPRQWFRGLNAVTRDRYPALLSYAVMLTPDIDEARRLTDNAIGAVMGSLRAPRTDALRDWAVRDHVVRAYADDHLADAAAGHRTSVAVGGTPLGANDAYAPPPMDATYVPPTADAAGAQQLGVHRSRHDRLPSESSAVGVGVGVGVGDPTSPLASALGRLSPRERVAAVSWWIDGTSAADVAERLGVTHHSAIDVLHRTGIALAAASGGTAPGRDHYEGGGDVVTVEVSRAERRV